MSSRVLSTFASWAGWLTSQSFCGAEADARPVRPTALVGAAEGCRRGPSGRDQLGDGKSRCEDLALEVSDVLRVDQLVIDCGHGVLPDQLLRRNLRAEIARARTHVAVGQLEPRPGEGIRELIRVLVEAPRNLFVGRVEAQGEVRGQHGWRATLRLVMRIRHRIGACATLRCPLLRTGRALGQFPFVAEQVPEEVVAPLRRRRGPGDFRAAADRVIALAAAKTALPAEALQFDAGGFRCWAHQRGIARAVGLAEGVSAGDERDGFLVVHGHAGKGLADVLGCGERIRIAVRPFRVHVDQTHLHGGERILEIPVTRVALVAKPGVLGAPVGVFVRLPDIGAPAAKAEGLEAHRLERDSCRPGSSGRPRRSCRRISA